MVSKAPPGFEKVKPTLDEFDSQLREVHGAKTSKVSAKKNEHLWQVLRIHHERSRYIYHLFYKRRAISKDLYEWLLRQGIADRQLIAKWKKRGYEKLCCLQCIQRNESTHGSTCICRVPRAQLERDDTAFHQCVHCGCHGCASTD